MDAVGLTVLLRELAADTEVARDAARKAGERLSLDFEALRPAFIPPNGVAGLRELKGFRHLVRHAYDLTLRPDRLAELMGIASQVATELPDWCTEFGLKVKLEQGWGNSTS